MPTVTIITINVIGTIDSLPGIPVSANFKANNEETAAATIHLVASQEMKVLSRQLISENKVDIKTYNGRAIKIYKPRKTIPALLKKLCLFQGVELLPNSDWRSGRVRV